MLLIFSYGDQTDWSADRLQILRFMMPIIAIGTINIKKYLIWTSVIIWAFISISMIIQATRHQGWTSASLDDKKWPKINFIIRE